MPQKVGNRIRNEIIGSMFATSCYSNKTSDDYWLYS